MRKYQFLKNDPVPLSFELGVPTVPNMNDTALPTYIIIILQYDYNNHVNEISQFLRRQLYI